MNTSLLIGIVLILGVITGTFIAIAMVKLLDRYEKKFFGGNK